NTVVGPPGACATLADCAPTTTVTAQPDLHLKKVRAEERRVGGDSLTYTITYSNTGNADASSVTFTDALPAHLTLVSATGAGVTSTGNSVTISLATLAADATGTATVVAKVDAVMPNGSTPITNTVVGPPGACATPADCAPTTTVTAQPDLHLKKVVDKATAAPGDSLTYTITYSSTGNADASSVTFTDALPTHLTLVSATGTGVTSPGNNVTISLATLAAEATGTATVVAKIDTVMPNGSTPIT